MEVPVSVSFYILFCLILEHYFLHFFSLFTYFYGLCTPHFRRSLVLWFHFNSPITEQKSFRSEKKKTNNLKLNLRLSCDFISIFSFSFSRRNGKCTAKCSSKNVKRKDTDGYVGSARDAEWTSDGKPTRDEYDEENNS